jgi:hypothetical protein
MHLLGFQAKFTGALRIPSLDRGAGIFSKLPSSRGEEHQRLQISSTT